jgi:hypothetical protein
MKASLIAAFGAAGGIAAHLLSDAREFYPTRPGDTWTYGSSIRGQFTNQVASPRWSVGRSRRSWTRLRKG